MGTPIACTDTDTDIDPATDDATASSQTSWMQRGVVRCFDTTVWNRTEHFVSAVLVPLYGLGVLLYITIKYILPKKRRKQKQKETMPAKKYESTSTSANDSAVRNLEKAHFSSLSSSSRSIPSLRTLSSSSALTTRMPIHKEEKDEEDDEAHHEQQQEVLPIDMNGSYKVVANHNFDQFLKVQGVPWYVSFVCWIRCVALRCVFHKRIHKI